MGDEHTEPGRRTEEPARLEPTRVRRLWVVWLAIFIGILVLMGVRDWSPNSRQTISQYRFEELVDTRQIIHATVFYDAQHPELNEVVGRYYKVEQGARTEVPFRATVRLTDGLEKKLLDLPEFELRKADHVLVNVLASVLPFVVIAVFIWFFFIRQIKRAAKAASSGPDPRARTAEQQDRFDKILDKWEDQANRLDRVLDKLDRDR